MVAMAAAAMMLMMMVMTVMVVVLGQPMMQVRRWPTYAQVTREQQVQHPFTCKGRAYGYYADPSSACKVFHICFPQMSRDGASQKVVRWSFTCPGRTIFNQKTHACTGPGRDVVCQETSDFYFVSDARDEI